MVGYNGYRITPATIADVQAIHRIDHRAFRDWPGDRWSLSYLVNQLTRPDLSILIAREGFGEELAVGYLITDRWAVVKIGVDQPRRGIGRSLISVYLDSLPTGATIGTAIRNKNEASIGLFTSQGFKKSDGILTKRLARTWGWFIFTKGQGES